MPTSRATPGYVLTAITGSQADWRPLGQVDVFADIRDALAALDLGAKRIVNVAAPQDAADVTTKDYVDTAIAPLFVTDARQLLAERHSAVILLDLSLADRTVPLPANHTRGDTITIKIMGKAEKRATITPNAAEKIDGEDNIVTKRGDDFGWLTLMSVGVGIGWIRIG